MNQWVPPSQADELALLRSVRTIAVIGISPNPDRPSYEVAEYLATQSDYELYFVNPSATSILGRPVVASLAELPVVPDLVDVFRRPEHLLEVAREAIAVGAKALWLQLGLSDLTVAALAGDAGLAVVMDRCLKVEHARLIGPGRPSRPGVSPP